MSHVRAELVAALLSVTATVPAAAAATDGTTLGNERLVAGQGVRFSLDTYGSRTLTVSWTFETDEHGAARLELWSCDPVVGPDCLWRAKTRETLGTGDAGSTSVLVTGSEAAEWFVSVSHAGDGFATVAWRVSGPGDVAPFSAASGLLVVGEL